MKIYQILLCVVAVTVLFGCNTGEEKKAPKSRTRAMIERSIKDSPSAAFLNSLRDENTNKREE